MDDTSKVMVCDKCLKASCWHGEWRCDASLSAGLRILTVADLKKLGREHPDNWSDEKMIEVYGDAKREFRV